MYLTDIYFVVVYHISYAALKSYINLMYSAFYDVLQILFGSSKNNTISLISFNFYPDPLKQFIKAQDLLLKMRRYTKTQKIMQRYFTLVSRFAEAWMRKWVWVQRIFKFQDSGICEKIVFKKIYKDTRLNNFQIILITLKITSTSRYINC